MFITSASQNSITQPSNTHVANPHPAPVSKFFAETVVMQSEAARKAANSPVGVLSPEQVERRREGLQNLMTHLQKHLQEKAFMLENMERELAGLPPIHRGDFGLSDEHPTMQQSLMAHPDLAPLESGQGYGIPIEHLRAFTEMISDRLQEEFASLEQMSRLIDELNSEQLHN